MNRTGDSRLEDTKLTSFNQFYKQCFVGDSHLEITKLTSFIQLYKQCFVGDSRLEITKLASLSNFINSALLEIVALRLQN
jgi:hypothetical protein